MPNPLFASLTAEPGPHPTTGELRDYAAGTLPPAAQHRVEAHTLACPRCADALAGWQQSPAAPADAAVARLRERLRQRVQEPDFGGDTAPLPTTVQPVAQPGAGSLPHGALLRRWAAAAAVAGLSVVGLWAWQHRGGEELTRPAVATEASAPAAGPDPEVAASSPISADKAVAQASAPTPENAAAATAAVAPAVAAAPVPTAATTAKPAAPAMRPASPAIAAAPARARPGATLSTPAMASADASGAAVPGAETADAAAPTADAPAGVARVPATAATAPAASPPSVAYNAPAKALKAEQAANRADDAKADRLADAEDARALPSVARNATGVGAARTATALPAPAPIAPAPVGGWLALRERLRRNAADFDPAENAGRLTGTVHLRLLIGADGRVQQSTILRGLRADYDAEALRLTAESAPLWQPGLANGRRAALPVEITVPF